MTFDFFFKSPSDSSYYEPIWENIMSLKEFKEMELCPHSKKWHREGDPMAHTRLVVNNAIDFLKNGGFCNHKPITGFMQGRVFLLSALFHDIGKPATTVENKDGDWSCMFHGEKGSGITRRILFDEDIETREAVCFMVRKHMIMHNFQGYKSNFRIKKELAFFSKCFNKDSLVTWDMMCALSLCDELGSVKLDESFFGKYYRQEKLIDFPKETCGISYETPFTSKDYDEVLDLMEMSNNKEREINVYVMIGVAGSGKSTYIEKNLSDLPIVSRDIMRAELGYCEFGEKKILTKEQENLVSAELTNKMIELADEGKDFVIDNMNLKLGYRVDYHMWLNQIRKIKWNYIYVESPSVYENVRRRLRDFRYAEEECLNVINGMVENLEFPYEWEYDTLTIVKQKNDGVDIKVKRGVRITAEPLKEK